MQNPKFVLVVVLLSSLPCLAQGPLPQDSVKIYKAFIAQYNNGTHFTLNIADQTAPFNPTRDPKALESCLKQIQMSAPARKQTHSLDESILPDGIRAQLVSAENSNQPHLILSEVIFDAGHRHAAMNYSFVCGEGCGDGGALLFENHDGEWRNPRQVCDHWMY